MFTLYNDPIRKLEPFTGTHLKYLFNNKTNKTYLLGNLTFSFLFKSMERFFESNENIDGLAELAPLRRYMGDVPVDVDLHRTIKAIPAELRWLFPILIHFDGVRFYTNSITLAPNNKAFVINRNPLPEGILWPKGDRVSGNDETHVRVFIAHLREESRKIERFLEVNGQKAVSEWAGLNYLADFWGHFKYWVQNSGRITLIENGDIVNNGVKPSNIPNDFVLYTSPHGHWFYYIRQVNITWDNRSKLYRVFPYSSNVTQYFTNKRLENTEGEDTAPLCGVELEISTNYSVEALIDACDDPFFMIKSDASVRGNKAYPYELVTCPMTFLAQKVYWAQFFDNLDYANFDTSLDTTNGMHIHIDNAAFLNELHRKLFLYFWARPQNSEFFLKFSARDLESFRRYSGVPKDIQGDREENLAYNPEVFLDRLRDDAGRPLRGIVTKSKKGGTVEVRLFRGVVSLADMIKNLEMVEAVFLFTKNAASWKDLELRSFLNFVYGQNVDTWEVLKEYLNTLDLDYCSHFAEIRGLFIGETRIENIAKLVTNSNLKLNDTHITCLNLYFGRKLFSYTNGEVQVRSFDTRQSAVAKFDTLVSARYNKKKELKHTVPKKKPVEAQPAPPPRAPQPQGNPWNVNYVDVAFRNAVAAPRYIGDHAFVVMDEDFGNL